MYSIQMYHMYFGSRHKEKEAHTWSTAPFTNSQAISRRVLLGVVSIYLSFCVCLSIYLFIIIYIASGS